MHVKCVEAKDPPVGVVEEIKEGSFSSGVVLVTCDCGSSLATPKSPRMAEQCSVNIHSPTHSLLWMLLLSKQHESSRLLFADCTLKWADSSFEHQDPKQMWLDDVFSDGVCEEASRKLKSDYTKLGRRRFFQSQINHQTTSDVVDGGGVSYHRRSEKRKRNEAWALNKSDTRASNWCLRLSEGEVSI
ncbi:hypothetical protein TNCV_3769311 [Trichonephila clavipes]|nr:hypothetical protein TNCV_3769311 [Trichonephila clavipes]